MIKTYILTTYYFILWAFVILGFITNSWELTLIGALIGLLSLKNYILLPKEDYKKMLLLATDVFLLYASNLFTPITTLIHLSGNLFILFYC
jgi:hypothetical protein